MIVKQVYVRGVRLVRSPLDRIGVLERMQRSQRRSVRWLRSLFSIYDFDDMAKIGDPWWTYAAIEDVDRFLAGRTQPRAFEYGSGASTLWLAQRCADVVSVEHDEAFGRQVRQVAPTNVRLEIVPCVSSTSPAIGSGRRGYERCDFTDYVRAIDKFDGAFDLIIVDGRARAHCLEHALDRVADGGVILFDNARRKRYRAAIAATRWSERRLRGLAPGLPYPSCTTLLVSSPGRRDGSA